MNKEYSRLKWKIFLLVLGIIAAALAVGGALMHFVVDGFLQDPFARVMVQVFQQLFGLSRSAAEEAYRSVFWDHKDIWVMAGYTLLVLVSFYIGLSYFTRYFREIGRGLDKLTMFPIEDMTFSPELDFMEKKMTTVKAALEKRDRDAKDAEQKKNDLVMYLAHDIKTPLTSVIAYLSLLDESPDMPTEQRAKYVGLTLDKAYRLEQLIDEFFEITRFNLQCMVLNREELDLRYMLLQMADEFYPLVTPQGKSIVIDAPEELPITADPDKLARVFNNILKNAVAYSYDGTAVTVTARREAGRVTVVIANRGKTIPENKLESIFEKFYRLDNARSTRSGGSGLGLAIAKEIVAAHGGTIAARSEKECTTFTVTLPVD